MTLDALADKRSVTVVRALCDAVERHGTPEAIRTDNEAIFHSCVFKTALKLLGIRHQTTELHCPWQNGRIERSSARSRTSSTGGWSPMAWRCRRR
jgi:putative transposase